MNELFVLLSLQALLGATDNLVHHEISERLPAKRSARYELALHTAREGIYAVLFVGLAWWQWHGAWALVLAALMVAEVVITCLDFLEEDRTRKLPGAERVLHTVLALIFGAVLATLMPVLITWWRLDTGFAPVDYGAWSWLLSFYGAGVALWALRDFAATVRHYRPAWWQRYGVVPISATSSVRVLITGGTGLIGRAAVRALVRRGDRVTVWTRDAQRARDVLGPHVNVVDALQEAGGTQPFDAVINLAGAPILDRPWTRRRRKLLLTSRVRLTRDLVQWVAMQPVKPRVLLSASAVGFYGTPPDAVLDESARPTGQFQSRLCQAWEYAARRAERLGVRVACLRFGVVISPQGGAWSRLSLPLRFKLSVMLGDGRQWLPWIHIDDVVDCLLHGISSPTLKGPVNVVAPQALRHEELMAKAAAGHRAWLRLRMPAKPLRLLLGEMAEVLLDGQHVVPGKLFAEGFRWGYPRFENVLQHSPGDTQAFLTGTDAALTYWAKRKAGDA